MGKKRRNQSLLLASSVILLVMLFATYTLLKNTRQQFEEQYAERLHSGLTTFGILLNYSFEDFSASLTTLALSEDLLQRLQSSDSAKQRNDIIMEAALQLGSDALYLIDDDGSARAGYSSALTQPPDASGCFNNLGKLLPLGSQLFYNKAARLQQDNHTLGYLCASMALANSRDAQRLESLVRGKPFLQFRQQRYFLDPSMTAAAPLQPPEHGLVQRWQLGRSHYIGKTGSLSLGYDELDIGLLIENALFSGTSREAVLALVIGLFSLLTLGLLSLRALFRQYRTQGQLNSTREQALITLSSIADSVITTTDDGRIAFMNGAAESLLRRSLTHCLGRPWNNVIRLRRVQGDNAEPILDLNQALTEPVCSSEDLLLRSGDTDVPVRYTVAPISRQRRHQGFVVVLHDMSREFQLRQQLAWRAHHDELTALPNRHSFYQRLDALLGNLQQDHGSAALLYLDLDHFKAVNDSCGHAAGDELLRSVCLLMQQQLRDTDLLARLGGDEFAVILPHCNLQNAATVADKLRDAVSSFDFCYDEQTFRVGVSIGLTMLDQHCDNLCEVLRRADAACYDAKRAGRNRVALSNEVAAQPHLA